MSCRVCDPGPCFCPSWDRADVTIELRDGPLPLDTPGLTDAWSGASITVPRHSDAALETLALIAEHRLTLAPHEGGWWVTPPDDPALLVDERCAYGATIGDAVRACVANIRSATPQR